MTMPRDVEKLLVSMFGQVRANKIFMKFNALFRWPVLKQIMMFVMGYISLMKDDTVSAGRKWYLALSVIFAIVLPIGWTFGLIWTILVLLNVIVMYHIIKIATTK